jgi:hypothetical protein
MGDFLFNWTEWLKTTFLLDWATYMQETGFSLFMVENFWNVPIEQVIHILSIGAAFGATLMVVLRVNGRAGAGMTMERVAARFVPWISWGLLVIVMSGLAMLLAEPFRNMLQSVFWLKMILLVTMVLISLAYARSARKAALAVGPEWQGSGGARLTGWLVIVLWFLIMACGRWIAYAPS